MAARLRKTHGTRNIAIRILIAKGEECLNKYGIDYKKLVSKIAYV